jgi:hypothetical protein
LIGVQNACRHARAHLFFIERAIAKPALDIAGRRYREVEPAEFVVRFRSEAGVKLTDLSRGLLRGLSRHCHYSSNFCYSGHRLHVPSSS